MIDSKTATTAESGEMDITSKTIKANSLLERQNERFEKLKTGLNNSLTSARYSPYGRESIPEDNVDNYKEFRKKIPLLTPDKMNRNPLDFVRVDENNPLSSMRVVESGSSTGKPKTTYHAEHSSMTLSKDLSGNAMDILKSSSSLIFIHENKNTMSYGTVDNFAEKNFPKAHKLTYNNAPDFIELIRQHGKDKNTVYLTVDVASLRSLIDQLKRHESNKPNYFEGLNISELFVDIVAEPINIKEITEVYKYLFEKFMCKPKIAIAYSTSEFGLIGLYIYKPDDTEIKYKVKKDLFVESLDLNTDLTGKIISNDVGDIIITSLDKKFGSIYPRYVTGDRAKIFIDEKGDMFIGEIGRDESKGQISLRGEKIYAPTLYNRLKEQIPFPVKVQFQKLENSSGTKTKLIITLSSERFKSESQIQDKMVAEDILNKLINEEPLKLFRDMNKGQLEIITEIINQVPEGFNKGWRILPEASLETYEQETLYKKLNELNNEGEQILKRDNLTSLDLLPYWKRLINVIFDHSFSDIPENFFISDNLKPLINKARKMNDLFERLDEQEMADAALRGDTELAYKRLVKTYEFSKKEAIASQIDKNSRVLFIGGGSIPISPIAYDKNFGCKGVIIDNDPKAIEYLKKVVKAFNLSDKFEVQEADGMSYNCNDFTHVVIAAMVTDKYNIINSLLKTMGPETKILCRSTNGLKNILYESLSSIPDGFKVIDTIKDPEQTFSETIILQKK